MLARGVGSASPSGETILWDYLDLGLSPEQIASRYEALTLERVFATLTYYWRETEELDSYLHKIENKLQEQRQQQELHPSPALTRLRALAQRRKRAATLDTAI